MSALLVLDVTGFVRTVAFSFVLPWELVGAMLVAVPLIARLARLRTARLVLLRRGSPCDCRPPLACRMCTSRA